MRKPTRYVLVIAWLSCVSPSWASAQQPDTPQESPASPTLGQYDATQESPAGSGSLPRTESPLPPDSFNAPQPPENVAAPATEAAATAVPNLADAEDDRSEADTVPVQEAESPNQFRATIAAHGGALDDVLIGTLASLGITTVKFAEPTGERNSLLVVVPGDAKWAAVRRLEEELSKLPSFDVEIRVEGSEDTATPFGSRMDLRRLHWAANARRSSPDAAAANNGTPSAAEQVMQVFPLKHTSAEAIAELLRQLFPDSNLTADRRSNAIILRDHSGVLREVEQLLQTLDVPTETAPAAAPQGSAQPEVERGIYGGGQVFRFEHEADSSLEKLRARYRELDQRTRELAATLRKDHDNTAASNSDPLQNLVKEAFQAQQALQQAELKEFSRRLSRMQQSLENRERIAEKIVQRRVEELLDPEVEWEQAPRNQPPASRPTSSAQPRMHPRLVPAPRHSLDSLYQDPAGTRRQLTMAVNLDPYLTVLGLRVREAFDELSGTGFPGGLEITEVRDNAPAAKAGLRPGDIIVGVAKWSTTNFEEFSYALRHSPANKPAPLFILRGDGEKESMKASIRIPEIQPASLPPLGTIVSRGEDQAVVISLGTADSVRPGDRLTVSSDGTNIGLVEITEVAESQSSGRILEESAEMPIRKGDKLLIAQQLNTY